MEVSAKGVWHVYTACDTDISGYSCGWDIIVTPLGDNTITAKEGDRLEKADYLGWYGDYSVQMVTDTSYDIDGFFFEANPDGAMRVDVYLDGAPAPRFIYWVGDGALHKGSPTNPIDLTPTTL